MYYLGLTAAELADCPDAEVYAVFINHWLWTVIAPALLSIVAMRIAFKILYYMFSDI